MSNAKLNAYNLWDGMSIYRSGIKGFTRGDDGEGGFGALELSCPEDISWRSNGQAWWDVNTKRVVPVR
jgi:hypothetical protein